MNRRKEDIDNRLNLYKKGKHIPIGKAKKYTFEEIDTYFDNLKTNFQLIGTRIEIKYYKYLPQIHICVILNCANADAANAGYRINHCVTQEGQIFHDSDVFASSLADFYPFDFKNELLYVTNVTFHNNGALQWDPLRLRTNDVIFPASKRIKNSCETEKMRPDLKRIIESIFKVAFINGISYLYLWPIGCGVFKNNQRIVAELFVETIKKNIGYFKEIVMVIYDKNRNDKVFNDSFINELHINNLNYKIN